MSTIRSFIVVFIVLALSACTTLDGKSPDEMVRYAVKRSLSTDNRFNFEGTATFRYEQTASSDVADHEQSQQVKALDEWFQFWMAHASVPFTGAVDLPAKTVEVIPEIRYEAKNALLTVKFPLRANLDELSLVIDPAAVEPFVKISSSEIGERISGKSVRLQMPDEMRQKIPVNTVLQAWPQAIDRAYADIDKQAYTLLSMDNNGKKIGARYRVALDLQGQALMRYSKDFYDKLAEEVAAAGAKNPEADISPEQYQKAAEFIREIGQLLNGFAMGEDASDEVADTAFAAILDEMNVHYEMYLGGNGRLLAMRQEMSVPLPIFADRHIRSKIWVEFNHFGKPVFRFHPTAADTVDVSNLIGIVPDSTPEQEALPESLQKLADNPHITVEVIPHQAE